jgi:diguanylate cyclase
MTTAAALRKTKKPELAVVPEAPAAREGPRSSYHDRILGLAQRIRSTEDIASIIEAIDQALVETRALRGVEELTAARRKVEEAERNIESLRSELDQVKSLLHQDPLTETLNRRGIDESFRREASRSDRHGTSFSIALVDLDHFKALNDTFGHQTGDDALRHVAAVVRSTLRPNDSVGRYGGEEFLVMLPDTGTKESAAVMARVKRQLARQPLAEKTGPLNITFSAGVATRIRGETFDDVLARADAALYRAKRAGRNRVMLARASREPS